MIFGMKFILDGSAEVLLQPARYKIYHLLKKNSGKPMFVEQIAKETNIHPRMVSHHLDVMEEQKLITSRYEIAKVEGSKRGVAVRLVEVTQHADDVAKNVRESI